MDQEVWIVWGPGALIHTFHFDSYPFAYLNCYYDWTLLLRRGKLLINCEWWWASIGSLMKSATPSKTKSVQVNFGDFAVQPKASRKSANAKEPLRINRSGIAWRSVSPLPWAAKPAPLSNIILRRSLLLPFLRSMESRRNPALVAASISSHMPWSKCDRRKTLRYNVIQQYPEKPTSITDFAGCIGPSKGFKRHYQQARHSHPGSLNIRRSFI